ncbi:hypothetical protein ACFQY0_18710 [Haloferula chungangensis]|uniref:PH domain-containing protein n=1 Tax=Haloferula chungangensis TaxID=1048331 RepID=A0ABW2L9Y4_9BACT
MILGIVLLSLFINQLATFLIEPGTISKVSMLAWCAVFPVFIWIAYTRRTKRYFYITETQAGFNSPKTDECPCELHRVRDYHEDLESISITHDSISVPLGLELRRTQFTSANWETVRSTLSERIRNLSPAASVVDESALETAHQFSFKARRIPTPMDFFVGILFIAVAISQVTYSLDRDVVQILISLAIWPCLAWSQIGLIRKRLRSDLKIGLKSIKFANSQSTSDCVDLSSAKSAEATSYFIRIKHDAGILPFQKTLLLSHTFFAPEDWDQIQKLTLARLQKAGVLIHRIPVHDP